MRACLFILFALYAVGAERKNGIFPSGSITRKSNRAAETIVMQAWICVEKPEDTPSGTRTDQTTIAI